MVPCLQLQRRHLFLQSPTGESAFEAKDVTYNLLHEGKDFYRVADETPAGSFTVEDGEVSGIADTAVSEALNQAITDGVSSFEVGDTSYYFTLDETNGSLYALSNELQLVTKHIFATVNADTQLDYEFRFKAQRAMNGTADTFEAGGNTYRIDRVEDEEGDISATFYLVENGTEA